MRRKSFLILLAILILVLSLALAGCGGSTSEKQNAAPSGKTNDALADLKPVKMVLASDMPADPHNFQHAAALAFKKYVEEASQGKISVEINAGGALGDLEALMEQTVQGTVEASIGHTEGNLSIAFPDIQVISVPYLFRSVDHAMQVFEGPFGQKLHEEFRRKTGTRIIGFWDNGGFRNFTNNVREIKSPADLKGLKMRTMQIPAHIEMMKALGAAPTPISFSELYSALDTGVVDGEENSIPTFLMISLQEVQKYMTLDGHLFSMMYLVVNDQWYQSLPKPYQEIISQGGVVAGQAGSRMCRVIREKGLETMKKAGMKIYQPTPEELNQFKEATQDRVIAYIKKGLDHPELVDQIIEAADKAAQELGYK